MRRALQVARTPPSPGINESEVGAVVYDRAGDESAAARNDRVRAQDPTACAEILALREAGKSLGTWRLDGCTLVTTLEPGTMPAGALVLACLPRLVIGSWEQCNGAICSLQDVVRDRLPNHFVEVIPEVLMNETDALYLGTPQGDH